jgi:hypothetical protein
VHGFRNFTNYHLWLLSLHCGVRWHTQQTERSGGTFRVALHDAVASDEHGVGVHVSEGEREGRRLHSLQTVVFHVRDGRVAEAWALPYDQHATDEFWA